MREQLSSLLGLSSGEFAIILAVAVGNVAFGLFVVGYLAERTARRRHCLAGASEPWEPAPDPFVEGCAGERRAGIRRQGNPVQVLLRASDTDQPDLRGWVLDRCVDGLRLSVDQEVSVNTIFSVRAMNAPVFAPIAQIEVKNTRRAQEGWELHCRFVRVPTWDTLQAFG